MKIVYLIGLLLFFPLVAQADFKKAYGYYLKGHYVAAIPEFKNLAKMGHVQSQFMLGEAYENGRGVTPSKELAYAWYLLAKENGYLDAEGAYKNIRQKVPSKRTAKQAYQQLKADTDLATLSQRLFPVFTHYAQTQSNDPEVIQRFEPELSWSQRNRAAFSVVEFSLNGAGKVEKARAQYSYPDNSADEALIAAFRKWQFVPKISVSGELQRLTDHSMLIWLNEENKEEIKSGLNRFLLNEMAMGNGYSFFLKALLVQSGLFAEDDNISAHYLTAAVNGSEESQLRLADCLISGTWCKRDVEKAQKWLAMLPDSRAKTQLLTKIQLSGGGFKNIKQKIGVKLRQDSAAADTLDDLLLYINLIDSKHHAIKILQQSQLLHPNEPILSQRLVTYFIQTNQRERALEEVEKVKSNPNYSEIVKSLVANRLKSS